MKFNRRILMLTLCFCAVFAMMCVSASAEEETHGSHALCAGTTCTDPTHTSENHGSVNFEHKLTSDDSNNLCIDGTAVSVSSNCYELAAGNYYLASDITIGKNIQISAGNTVKICLNGRTITCNEQDAVIENRGTLDITDCKASVGKITHGEAVEASSETRGIDNYYGTLSLWNGSITGNTVDTGVSGVYNSGTFIMYGGSITQNSISSESNNSGGRGAVGNNGTFTMYGGGISGNNTADDGGGVYNYKNGSSLATFTMTGGEISNNTSAKNGGGVYNDGSFTMSGGRISNNQSKKETSATPKPGGGGVFNYGSFTMTGGEISNNTAAMNGGGVRNANGIFNMDGGIISGNKAGEEGGGVHNDSSVTFTMTAGKIEGNTAQQSGGGVYSYGAFTMSGGSITKNTSNNYNGGGVYSYGAFTMSGGSITENTSNNYNGGGVYVGNALKVSGSVQITGNKKGGTFGSDGPAERITMFICLTAKPSRLRVISPWLRTQRSTLRCQALRTTLTS